MRFLPKNSALARVAIVLSVIRDVLSLDGADLCAAETTCSDCIQQLGCAWCIQLNVTETRCFDEATESPVCLQLINPKTYVENQPLQANVQITPQRVNLRLRKGAKHSLNLTYVSAGNWSLDLYYLMDLSHSMEQHKAKLSKLGGELAKAMQEVTSNFRLGFGSFVDKVVMPYVDTTTEKLQAPCVDCVPPYSYKNHMALQDDAVAFSQKVKESNMSGNLDGIEGGFDGLLQAMVCHQEIGWRPSARHVIVFSTDMGYHMAGDGKLAGIVEPNDGACHMEKGDYTYSLKQDYPSVGQINYLAGENNINVIFAVANSAMQDYELLANYLKGARVGKLEDDSANVVELIRDIYGEISETVFFNVKSDPNLSVSLKLFCPNGNSSNANTEQDSCLNVKANDTVVVEVTLQLLNCDKTEKQTVKINPYGLSEKVVITIDPICRCDCEKKWTKEEECSGHKKVCGVCQCENNFFGKHCNCDPNHYSPGNESDCTARDGTVCSRHGLCHCGVCDCYPHPLGGRYYGAFCECDDHSCPSSGGAVCSGRGACSCGTCLCPAGWTGAACDCPTSSEGCRPPFSPDAPHLAGVCSGRGACSCGRCTCSSSRFVGTFCEACPFCSEQCKEHRACVVAANQGSNATTASACKGMQVRSGKVEGAAGGAEAIRCSYVDDIGCLVVYYVDTDNGLITWSKECPDKFKAGYVLWPALVTFLTILASLLLWKLITHFKDSREYARYLESRKQTRYDVPINPIFKPSTSVFRNPIFKTD